MPETSCAILANHVEQHDSPLFKLPPETRVIIYKYKLYPKESQEKTMTLLLTESPIEVINWDNALTLRPTNKFLMMCPDIYTEGQPIFAMY
jgi:hypothetical protein